jgi:hypothetical protein
MAGSYRHVTRIIRGEPTFIGPTLLDHMGDAVEALEELWFLVRYLSNDNDPVVAAALEQFYQPRSALAHDLNRRLRESMQNDYWRGRLEEVVNEKSL